MDILMNGDGWVQMVFRDGTVQSIHTSLNESFLRSNGAGVKQGYLFDLERLRYVCFREDATEVFVTKEKPEFDSEVLEFASKYI